MYLATVWQKIKELEKNTEGNIPSQNDPECILCRGSSKRLRTPEEVEECKKATGDYFPLLPKTTDCDCVNRERVKYDRQVKSLERLKKIANGVSIPNGYLRMCFGTYDANIHKDYYDFIEYRKIKSTKRGFMFVGKAGVGKTHLAISILHALMVRHYLPCLYVDVSELLTVLRNSYNTNRNEGGFSELSIIRKYQEIPVLLFDDISVEKVSEWVRDRIFQVMNWRYSRDMITLATSNDMPEDLAVKLGDRTMSRINALMDLTEMAGPDRRGSPELEKNLTNC